MSSQKDALDQSQSSQSGASKETHLSKEEFNRKVAEIVRYVLFADRKNIPIKKSDITKNILKNIHVRVTPKLIDTAFNQIEKMFGFHVQELDIGKAKMYILLNTIEHDEEKQRELFSPSDRKKMGVLMIVLSFIFMSDGVVAQDQLWSFLKNLGIEQGRQHGELGDVEKLINQEFTRQMYIEKKKITSREGIAFEYRWGVRAKAEISYRSVLAFVSEIYGVKIESWKNHYKLVLESEGSPMETDAD